MSKSRLATAAFWLLVGFAALTAAPIANAKISRHPAISHAAGPQFSSLVIDAKTGAVLEEYNADAHHYPASLTKLMTLYLTFGALESGRLQLSEHLRISAHAAAQAPSKLGLIPGHTITLEQAILALTVKSANDVAVVLGEALGGTESHFAELMTQKARELGMRSTTFRNASGLPNPGQVTTARDLAVLTRALIRDYPRDYHYFSAREFTFNGVTIPTHDHVLEEYAGADGLKTGYIHASGFNLVTSAVRDGHRLIGVVLGGTTSATRDRAMMRLLDTAFAEDSATPVRVANSAAPVVDRDKPFIPARPKLAPHDTRPTTQPVAFTPAATPTNEGVADDARDIDWGVQVGAFGRYALAHAAALRTKRGMASLSTATISITRLRVGGVTLYRARLIGLNEHEARTVCVHLHRHKSQCVLLAPASDRSIAQVSQ